MNIKFSKKLFKTLLTGTIALSTLEGYKVKADTGINVEYLNENNDFISFEESVTAITNVNIRKLPTVESEKKGLLYKGESLIFLGYYDNWVKVLYNEEISYIYSDYVKLNTKAVINKKSDNIGYVKKDTVLYHVDGSKKSTLSKYELCEIYDNGEYCLVKSNHIIGYVKKKDIEKIIGKCVVVDISDQEVILYNGTDVILTASIVSGNDYNPSDIGFFKVYSKRKDTYLTGETYSRHVNYWMAYNGGEGFHDADWRSKFGGKIYHKNGSHGCINMRLKDAEYLYNNVKVGTRVLVKK